MDISIHFGGELLEPGHIDVVGCLGHRLLCYGIPFGSVESRKTKSVSGRRTFGRVQLRWKKDGRRQFFDKFQDWELMQQQRRNYFPVSRALPAAGSGGLQGQQPERLVHFIGIGGVGLSALAFLALKQGWRVSGSDAIANDRLEALKAAGATVYVGHAPNHVTNADGVGVPDAVVVSSAIPSNNEEVEAARRTGLPIYKRGDWLGKVTEDYELLAVAGSHGKSTTSAMLAFVLRELGDDVSALVGADVPQFPGGGSAIRGQGRRFVLEADEYDGCFLGVDPTLAIVTNVEWEHVDIFPNEVRPVHVREASVRDIFKKFVLKVKSGGTLLVCGDSAGSKLLANVFREEEALFGSIADRNMMIWQEQRQVRRVLTFGLGNGNDWQAIMLAPNVQGGTDYVAVHAGRPMARVSLQIPGTHNVLNSLAVIVVVSLLGLHTKHGTKVEDELVKMKRAAEAAGRSLARFVGVRRRFEYVGQVKRCIIYDDYAHHPTEVRAVLQAARQRFDRHSVWVVFQPHTFSRLASLLQDFAPAFSGADRVIVTEVYSAREENKWNVSGADLAALITGPPAVYVPSLESVVERLTWELTVYETMMSDGQGRIVLLTLGAGDVTSVGYQLLQAFSANLK